MAHTCKFEDKIIKLCEDVAGTKKVTQALSKRINGSMDDFLEHIKAGHRWRASIVTISLVVILNIVTFAFLFGQQTEAIKTNQKMIERFLVK